MLLLLLQMKETRVSQASWLRRRMPVKARARFAKLVSEAVHCWYMSDREWERVK